MHTHVWVTGPTVQLRPHVTRNRRIATCGQRYNRSVFVWHRPKRAECAVSAIRRPSGPIASGGARAPATRWPCALGAPPGRAERQPLGRRSAHCGGRQSAAASGTSLPGGSVSVVRQPWVMGRRRRSRRGRQVTCREAIGAWMAGSERDRPRVRDAATHTESGCEVVEHRDPHRGIEPRCLAEAGGK